MEANWASDILTPVGYSRSTSVAVTRNPMAVVVVRMWLRIVW